MTLRREGCRALRGHRGRRGAAMLLLLLFLIPVLGMVAFAIDAGMMALLRAEVQNAVDSGALAAALTLQADPEALVEAEDAARDFIQENRAGVLAMIPEDAIDVERGRFDTTTSVFTATSVSPNAVRVFARQDNEPFLFAKVFGHTVFGAPASAIASGGKPIDIMMVLDLSGSMADQGRIEALRTAAPVFVDVIEQFDGNDLIGVMGLSANPSVYDPIAAGHTAVEYQSGLHPTNDHHVGVLEARLTEDYDLLRTTALSSGSLLAGKYTNYTGTGAALADAAHYLTYGAEARGNVYRAIVLMSDGHANRPTDNGPGYARAMAEYAAGLDVVVYTISLGNEADLVLMQDIADLTDGLHFDATGSGQTQLTERLTEAFKKAAAAIKRVQLVR
jgi:Flp pilus assembly protein TadG